MSPAGVTIPGLEVLEPLGAGAQGAVFRARRDGRDYAVKLPLRASQAELEPVRARRFVREAVSLARVHHPALPRVMEVSFCEGWPYLVMELASGERLSERFAKGPLPRSEILEIARQLADALDHVHASGLVHRDIKPDNILFDPETSSVRLVDFGFAAMLDSESPDDRAGTRKYMAPEQLRGERVDARADLYALGCVLFEGLSGASLDQREQVTLSSIDRELGPIIARLLSNRPDDRYPSAAAVRETLDRIGQEVTRPAVRAQPRRQHKAHLPLLGRDSELARLERAWSEAQSGRLQIAIVRGPAGSGKSCLLDAIAEEVEATGRSVLRSSCPTLDLQPFTAIRQLFEAHLDECEAHSGAERLRQLAHFRELAREAAALVCRISPRLAKLFSDAPRLTRTEDIEHVVTEGLAELCAKLVEDRAPCMVCVDDVQWLDANSRRVLLKLLDRLEGKACLVLLVARDDAPGRASIEKLIPRSADNALVELPLSSLRESDSAALVRAYLGGGAVDEAVFRAVAALSDGTPLSVLQVVRSTLDAGAIVPSWGTWKLDTRQLAEMQLPRGTSAILAQRIARLEPSTAEVLTAGAVLGMRFDDALIMTTCELGQDRVDVALADACRSQLIEARAGGAHEFVHGEVRDALLSRLSETELRTLHQRTAEALDGQSEARELEAGIALSELLDVTDYAPEDADRAYAIALHYAMGDVHERPERVLDASVRAAKLAFRSFDNLRALRFFRTAERAAGLLQHELAPEVVFLRAEAHLRSGALDEALKHFEALLELTSDRILTALALSRMAWVHMQLDETAAWDCLRRAFRALGRRAPDDSFFSIVVSIGRWLWRPIARRAAVRTTHERRELEVLCALYYQAGRLAYQGSKYNRLLQSTLSALAPAERLGASDALARSYSAYTFLLTALGRQGAARRYLAAAEQVARETRDPVTYSHALQVRCSAAAWMGDTHDAIAAGTRTIDKYGHWRELSELCLLAYAVQQFMSAQGRCLEAWRWLELAIRKVEQHEGPPLAVGFLEQAGRALLIAMGRGAEADSLLAKLQELTIEPPKSAIFAASTYGVRVRRYTEEMRLDDAFEAIVDEVKADGLDPRKAHLELYEYYLHVAHARLHQCLRAETEHDEQLRIAAFQQALSDYRHCARIPLHRAHHLALDGCLQMLLGRGAAAEARLAEAEALGMRETAPWVLYTVHRGRAHLLRKMDRGDAALDQAHLACVLAAQHGAAQRLSWIREEFALLGDERPYYYTSGSSRSPVLRHKPPLDRSLSQVGATNRGYLRALRRITQASVVALDAEHQARLVIDEITRALGADRGLVFLAPLDRDLEPQSDQAGQSKIALLSARSADGADLAPPVEYDRAMVAEVMLTGVVDARDAVTLKEQGSDNRRPCAALAAPLQVQGRVVGAVYLERALERGAFTDSDREVLSTLAAQVPVALELARLLYERERAAEAVRIAEKMDALGRFAGGVAHDFRNLFQQVLITADWLSEQETDPSLGEHLGAIRESIRRAARLTERLNDFARSGAHHTPEIINLNGEIDAMRPVLENLLGGNIELELIAGSELWNVKMDVAQLDQVLLNLLVNARDAMPQGGRVTIETRNMVLDESYVHDHPWLDHGECVELCVTDTGSGMDAETRSHIFEPYFTTKAVGRGTGLGLATVYGAVRQNGGQIDVESEPTLGTTFRIQLPRTLAPLSTLPKLRELPEGESGAWKQAPRRMRSEPDVRGPRVLVVDDDHDVRDALCRMLSARGYAVVPASGPDDALAIFRAQASEIDAVVTDLVMPGMNGIELMHELARLREVPTILVSGASDAVLAEHGLIGAQNFLAKPVFPGDLDAKLRELVDASGTALRPLVQAPSAISGRSSP